MDERKKLLERLHAGNLRNTWHIIGDRLIPLAPVSLVGFYM